MTAFVAPSAGSDGVHSEGRDAPGPVGRTGLTAVPRDREEIRIARIIGRLNVGGPAIQAISLTRLLEPRGYRTLLLSGMEETEHEGSMIRLAHELGVEPVRFSSGGREIGATDVPALLRLVLALRRFQPHIVHTHAAKGGTLGRLATLLSHPRHRPVIMHTFHGHSLEGYFSPMRARVFRAIECALARRTSRLIAVSEEIKADLVRLRVAGPEQIEVVSLGFDLGRFETTDARRAELRTQKRREWGVPADAAVVTLIARLVPIKRVDRFLRIADLLAADRDDLRFVVVGDGQLRDQLRREPISDDLRPRLVWAGFDQEVPAVCFASDVVVLTSDNEGTPVSLIEAQAAGVPVVATRVGGTSTVVLDRRTGLLVEREDEAAFAEAVLRALADGERLGAAGRQHVLASFTLDRLLDDLDRVYRASLEQAALP